MKKNRENGGLESEAVVGERKWVVF